MMRPSVILSALLLLAGAAAPSMAAEKMLKLRSYTWPCGGGQECIGWRHSFAYLDPATRLPEPPRDSYVEIYSSSEVDARLDKLESDVVRILDDAFARAGQSAAGAPSDSDQLRRLRDDVAADVVAQLGRIMAERETQIREWLQHQIREELRAAGVAR